MSSDEFQLIAIDQIIESPHNPRKHFDPDQLAELAQSVRESGIISPLLLREIGPKPESAGVKTRKYEIAAGHRRFRAAKLAGLVSVPAIIRQMSDHVFLEILTIENLQRVDLHPLEEADGYQALRTSGYEVGHIAARVGRSVAYIYDRLKLSDLVPEVRSIFLENRITAGHAIVLARIAPQAQRRAIDKDRGGLWSPENLLWDPGEVETKKADDPSKVRTVRELQGWIDEHVKFDMTRADLPDLFADTAAVLARAEEAAEKIVPITYDHYVQPEARDENRIFGPRSWKRADGLAKSKPCDRSAIGVVVIGPGRGEAFRVCTAKKACKTHWGKEQRELARRAKNSGASEDWKEKQRRENEKWERERKENERQDARWKAALDVILKELAERVSKSTAIAGGVLANCLIDGVSSYGIGSKQAGKCLPLGRTPDDVIRHAVFILLQRDASNFGAWKDFPEKALAFGVKATAIVDRISPEEKKAAVEKKPNKAVKKKATKKTGGKKK